MIRQAMRAPFTSVSSGTITIAASTIPGLSLLDFELPREFEAGEPPEARGLARDEVRLMVSRVATDEVTHNSFRQLEQFLDPGDVLVINTSGTMNAALQATRDRGEVVEMHLSTHLPADLWIVELRQPGPKGTQPLRDAQAGETLSLPAMGQATLLVPYEHDRQKAGNGTARLWVAVLKLPDRVETYLARYGFPIRYSYVREAWPIQYYQTVYATEMGSAEMPSAGRAFTNDLLTRLVSRGIEIVPVLLHTGVASLEDKEPPYEEYYRVSLGAARRVNQARVSGRRVIAVGTTAVRALETVVDEEGQAHPGEGWTRLVITPERGLRVVNGLLTGFHEPRATHLAMIEALCGQQHLRLTYSEALRNGYLWHEFGDLHLILP